MRRVVVTGLGMVSPLGCGVEPTWKRILASESGDRVDKQIEPIAKEVQKRNPHLKSFKFKAYECQALAREVKAVFKLVDNKTASVIVRQGRESDRANLAVVAPDQPEIDYPCAYDKYFPILTDHVTPANERLILAIRVQSCQ